MELFAGLFSSYHISAIISKKMSASAGSISVLGYGHFVRR
jgi:hypothetical protein